MTGIQLPTLKTEQRQRLYYQQYRYAIELKWQGFEYLNRLDLEWVIKRYSQQVLYSWKTTYITQEQVVTVAQWLADFERQHGGVKAVNSWYTRFYYTNDAEDINVLSRCPEVRVVDFREADVCLTDGVLIRKKYPYKYRT